MNLGYRFSEAAGSGSATFGYDWHAATPGTAITVILNRWHDMTRPGTTLVTILAGMFSINLNAVDDGFGNLILLSQHERYHSSN